MSKRPTPYVCEGEGQNKAQQGRVGTNDFKLTVHKSLHSCLSKRRLCLVKFLPSFFSPAGVR